MKMINLKTIKTLLTIFILLSFLQCNSNNEQNLKVENPIKPEPENSIDSLGIITYHLFGSDYFVKMRLSKISSQKVINAFSIKEDEYSVPIKKNGYLVKINFTVNNPYDKELVIPIPHYFSISNGIDSDFSNKTLFNKTCQCYIINTTDITNIKGKKLYLIADGECSNDRNCLIFKPNETKEFIVKFDEPIIESQKEILLFGFNLYWKDPNRTRKTDVGLIIDVEKGSIRGLKPM